MLPCPEQSCVFARETDVLLISTWGNRVERLVACHGIASTSLGEVTQECGSLAVQTLSEALPPLRYSFPLPDSWAILPPPVHP